jgi:hypothetical protein
MKSKMIEHLTKCAEFHTGCAKAHDAAAKESSGAVKKFHEASRDLHSDAGEHCVQMCKTLVASNSDSIDDTDVGSEGNRGKGGDLDGPSKKAADAPFGMVAALHKSPSFGMTAARRDLDKIAPTEVHGVVSSQREFIPRVGGPSSPSTVDPTSAIDSLLK